MTNSATTSIIAFCADLLWLRTPSFPKNGLHLAGGFGGNAGSQAHSPKQTHLLPIDCHRLVVQICMSHCLKEQERQGHSKCVSLFVIQEGVSPSTYRRIKEKNSTAITRHNSVQISDWKPRMLNTRILNTRMLVSLWVSTIFKFLTIKVSFRAARTKKRRLTVVVVQTDQAWNRLKCLHNHQLR